MIVTSGYVELGSDGHTFVIRADAGLIDGIPWDGSTLVTIPDDVNRTGDVYVNTGDQWGPFGVTTEVHETTPEDDPTWEDVVEVTLTCAGGLLVAEMVNHDPCMTLVSDPGVYRIRVCARGRTDPEFEGAHGDIQRDDEGTVPVEHYLIQAWPVPSTSPSAPVIVRETSSWAAARLAGPRTHSEVEGAERGLAAAARIGRDVDRGPDARALSGQVASFAVERRVHGTRRKVSTYLKYGPTLSRHIPSWDLIIGGSGWDQPSGTTYCGATEGHPDQLSGTTGLIRTTLINDTSGSWVSHWAWMVPGPDRDGGTVANLVPLFVGSTVVTTRYTQTKGDDGQPWTLVRVRHERVPVEWAEDLTAWWTYQLSVLASLTAPT